MIDGITTRYVYNGLDQLKEERKSTGGRLTSKTDYTYDNSGNRIKEREEIYTYSDKGVLLTGSEGTCVEEINMSYTPENMTSLFEKRINGKKTITQKNRYDGDGQRIRKEETALS